MTPGSSSSRTPILGRRAQCFLAYLPYRGPREPVDELDRRRDLEPRQTLSTPNDNPLFGDLISRMQDDVHLYRFVAHLVRYADRSRFEDTRMAVDHRLDLGGRDVLPRALDHVLRTVHEANEPVGIDDNRVPGVEPPVPDRRRRRLRVVQIAGHQRPARDALDQQLPHVPLG